MPTETLHIQNFAGIKDAEISLARFNLFIGPQASGKSVTAKLFYFFKKVVADLGPMSLTNDLIEAYRNQHQRTFLRYFPKATWAGIFEICYSCGEFWIRVSNMGEVCTISYAPYLTENVRKVALAARFPSPPTSDEFTYDDIIRLRQQIASNLSPVLANECVFIPAGRSFFSIVQSNIFGLTAQDIEIDPFLLQFGRLYENFRKHYPEIMAEERITPLLPDVSKIVKGRFGITGGQVFIDTEDKRRMPIAQCSSGQQEAFPLALLLAHLRAAETFFIEEPEAHLYPSTQRDIIHLLSTAADKSKLVSEDAHNQYLITTHSPYILSALNNLMYAGQIAEKFPDRKAQVAQVIDNAAPIAPGQVQAYMMQDGTAKSIIDEETDLVRATLLDEVSGELAQEFEQLMDIEFKEE